MRALRRRDDGYTLVELMVALGIFSFVVAIFMAGVVVMTRNTALTSARVEAQSELRTAFQRLDKQVRYADAVNLPGAGSSGAIYVEFRTPATVAASGVTTCTQWRYVPSTGVVQARTWEQSATALPGFGTVITDVSGPSAPFTLTVADPEHPRQSLSVRFEVDNAKVDTTIVSESSFVARNSGVDSPGNADTNGDGISDLPACWRTGVRP